MPSKFTRTSANLANGNFVPQVWSKKLQAKFYAKTSLDITCNTDWEGEVKGQGSEVMIRVEPNVTVDDYIPGKKINYQDLQDDLITLPIDKAKIFAFRVDDIDAAQTDIKIINTATTSGSKNTRISIEKGVYGSVYASATSTIASAQATKLTVIDWIVDANVLMSELNVPEEGRWILMPYWVGGLIKKSDLKSASISGDLTTSVMRKGVIGMVDGTQIILSNNLAGGTTVGSPAQCMAGHRSAISFASQFVRIETIRLQDTMGDAVRGLNVYGYAVTKPDSLISMPVYK